MNQNHVYASALQLNENLIEKQFVWLLSEAKNTKIGYFNISTHSKSMRQEMQHLTTQFCVASEDITAGEIRIFIPFYPTKNTRSTNEIKS